MISASQTFHTFSNGISKLIAPGVPRWFAVLGLLFGSLYAAFMGPLSIPDEGGHMYRAFLVSEGYCTGVPAIGVPLDYRDLDHRVTWHRLSRNSTGRDLVNMVDDAHGLPLPVISLFFAVNLYSCVPYLPAGAAFNVGRIFTGSPLTLMYLGRFANLLFFVLMVLLAMRILPDFQLPLAILALMPMSLHQAASLSADAVTNALAFVLVAFILRLATAEKQVLLTRWDYLWLVAGAVLAGLCKSNAGLLFLLLLIPGVRFPDWRMRWLTVAGCIALAYGTVAAWQIANRPNGEVHETLKHAAGIYPSENSAFAIHHPFIFLGAVRRTFALWGDEYLNQFVGKLGPLLIGLPEWIPWAYLILLFTAAAAWREWPRLSRPQRMFLAAIFLLNLGTQLMVVWTTETPRDTIVSSDVAENSLVRGLQGRYLIPFAPLLLLAVSGLAARRIRGPVMAGPGPVVTVMGLVIVVNVVALDRAWDYYQAHSSTLPNRIQMAFDFRFANTPENAGFLYDNRVISSRDPGASPFMVSDGARHLVPNKSSVMSRGYKWPNDILLVSNQELNAIPIGAPLPLTANGKYEGKLVRRPGSTAEDSKVYLIRDGQKHWIADGHWITAHGYKWPDDINTIAAPDLAQIPLGDPIQ